MSNKADKPPWGIVEAKFFAAAQRYEQVPPQLGAELAFAGRSNVGKSSLLNALMSRKRLVRTSSTPGCTRQINFFQARARDGAEFRLIDLPGYGYAKRSKTERNQWAQLVEAYLTQRDVLRTVAVLVDARRGVGDVDQQLIEFVESRKLPAQVILVATKIDRIQKSKRKAALAKLKVATKGHLVAVSASNGDGIEQLWRTLRRAASVAPL